MVENLQKLTNRNDGHAPFFGSIELYLPGVVPYGEVLSLAAHGVCYLNASVLKGGFDAIAIISGNRTRYDDLPAAKLVCEVMEKPLS